MERDTDMKAFGAFALELGAFLSLCLMLAILMGVPALWSLIGTVILFDAGVILFLSKGSRHPNRPTPLRAPAHRRSVPG
jgi:hypothetical protein